ncbi:MAG: EAL domain-containing protein [Lachnospiraceae bacterium]|nr:EAL domain-containing protein [Lachnospiraceae bacterium]
MSDLKSTGKLTRDEIGTYVKNNIDRAIEEGFIKVYYQPVVRTLTEEVCGMEALARWDDPEYGLLSPDIFIGALEESRQIHKLDMCMIRQICRNHAEMRKRDNVNVTISFNLSWMDFQLADIHSVIEEEIRKNRLPRDAFRVEITESMMGVNEDSMHDVIDRFWERGLRVWMDDFGSGYSSLNVLKDYRFDTLKIDMIFLRHFDIRAQEIVKSVVDMAKRIGVHTLAEGVENHEQLLFLKSIGCEKAQGFYIGKPQPYEECRKNLEEKGFPLESPAKRKYYHDIGKVNVLSATPLVPWREDFSKPEEGERQIPLAFVELKGKEIHYLFANESYNATLHSVGIESPEQIERTFQGGETGFGAKFLGMMMKAKNTGNVVSADFVEGNNYCFAQVRSIAGYPGGNAFLVVLQNLSENTSVVKNALLAEHMQSLYSIYDGIELIDLKTGYSENLYRSNPTVKDYNIMPAQEELLEFAVEEVYPEDQDQFREFCNLETLEERLKERPVKFLAHPFRLLRPDGNYDWFLFIFLFAGEPGNRKVLSCTRRMEPGAINIADSKTMSDSLPENAEITPELLWTNHMMKVDFGFFWKDKNRRFLGANRRMLSWFGMSSQKELIGKTSEELGWHVNPDEVRAEEEKILNEGIQTYRTPGTVICRGEIKDVEVSRMPIYLEGKIVGLMGYFIDVTDRKTQNTDIRQLTLYDSQTGSLNFLGLMEAGLKYQESFVMENRDFAVLFFDIEDFRKFNKNYGLEWGNKLLKTVLERIKGVVGITGVTGRFGGDHFIVLYQFKKKKDIEKFIGKVLREISKIEDIDGIPCTVYMKVGSALFSEIRDLEELIHVARERAKKQDGVED